MRLGRTFVAVLLAMFISMAFTEVAWAPPSGGSSSSGSSSAGSAGARGGSASSSSSAGSRSSSSSGASSSSRSGSGGSSSSSSKPSTPKPGVTPGAKNSGATTKSAFGQAAGLKPGPGGNYQASSGRYTGAYGISTGGAPATAVLSQGYRRPPYGVGYGSNRYYGAPYYGYHYYDASNFFMWAWIFHATEEDDDPIDHAVQVDDSDTCNWVEGDEESDGYYKCDKKTYHVKEDNAAYQRDYAGEPNYGSIGYVVTAGLALLVGLGGWFLYKAIKRY